MEELSHELPGSVRGNHRVRGQKVFVRQAVVVVVDGDYEIRAGLVCHQITDIPAVIGVIRHHRRRQAGAFQEGVLLVDIGTANRQPLPS